MSTESRNELLALALRGGEQILRNRTVTTMGIRFPAEPYPGKKEIRYELKLYDGAAGIGIVMLDLYAATGDSRFVEMCEEISNGLIESTPEFGPLPSGLYSSFSGVALFHLACARILKKRISLDRAVEMGKRLARVAYEDTDLMSGAAGSGLFHLALYHATRDSTFLDAARSACAFLADTATSSAEGVAWFGRDPRQPLISKDESYIELATQMQAGLAHGVAGICLFLLELADVTADPTAIRLYEQGFRWLESRAMRLRNGLVWTRSDQQRLIQNHWCHGSTGIAHAYLAKYRLTGEVSALNHAEAAVQATWDFLQGTDDEPTYHCHGLSGAIEIFLDLTNHGAEEVWRQRARILANRIKRSVVKEGEQGESGLGGKGSGLELGTAGIVRQLLRLSGYSVFPILTPMRDEIILPAQSIPQIRNQRKKRIVQPIKVPQTSINDLVPPVGVRFSKTSQYAVIGPAEEKITHEILRRISDSRSADAYFQALHEVHHACDRLQADYSHLLCPEVLHPRVLGPVIREIAGLVLRTEADPAIVRRASRRMTVQGIRALELMFERLAADVPNALGRDIGGRITRVQVLGSDPHRHGQRVTELQFEEGPLLLYKSRSVAIDRELAGTNGDDEPTTLAQLCRTWLHPNIPGGLLPLHRLIVAGQWHGYAEAIHKGKTTTLPVPEDFTTSIQGTEREIPSPEVIRLKPEEEERYFYSAGLLAGHAFTLSIQDLHAENVICGKSISTPDVALHAVDLEMAFGNAIDLEDTHLIDGPRWVGEDHRHTHAPLLFPPDFTCALYAEAWIVELTANGPSPVQRPWRASRWIFPHLVQNADGSFGYSKHVCAFLRGFADQWWMLQTHKAEIGEHLRKALQNVPMRVVFKPTRSYVAALIRRKMGKEPLMGIAFNPAVPGAFPFHPEETSQMDAMDVPYFFRFLENDSAEPSAVYYFGADDSRYVQMRNAPPVKYDPFWTIVERQADPNRLARAVVDVAWAVAPRKGPFDFHDPSLGIRLVRRIEDERMLVIVLLGEKHERRLTCRVAPEGQIDWWLD